MDRSDLELVLAIRQHGEHQGDEAGEERQQQEVTAHHFRPIATSKASMTTSMFRRPATMRNVLPYS